MNKSKMSISKTYLLKQKKFCKINIIRITMFVMAVGLGYVQNYCAAIEISPEASTKFEEYLTDQNSAERWCRWTLTTPTGEMYDQGAISASGISPVNIVWERGNNYSRQVMIIENFRNLYNLTINTQAFNFDDGTSEPALINENTIAQYLKSDDKTGVIRRLTKNINLKTPSYDKTKKYISFENFNKLIGPRLCQAKVNVSGNLELIFNLDDGYVMYFGSGDGMLPMTGAKMPTGTTLEYYRSFKLELFTSRPNVQINIDNNQRATVATIDNIDFNGTEGQITLKGLYGYVKEQRADCYKPTPDQIPTIEDAPIVIELNADGSALIDRRYGQAGPVLNTTVEAMKVKAAGNEYSLPMNAKERNLWFYRTTYSPQYCSEMLIKDKQADEIVNAEEVTYQMLVKLNEDIRANIFDGISGQWHLEEKTNGSELKNPHWIRHENIPNIKINFEPHYIIPIIYSYNTDNIEIKTPRHIDSLSLITPFEAASISGSFSITHYGYGTVSDDDPSNQLYISAKISGDKIEAVYIVRGNIEDYNNDKLGDTTNGHQDGLLISSSQYNTDFYPTDDINIEQTANSQIQRLNVLIPEEEIPGQKTSSNIYTLYSRSRLSGKPVFEKLAVLDRTTTDIRSISNNTTQSIIIDGNQLKTQSSAADVFDISGRLIAKIEKFSTFILSRGTYIVKTADKTNSICIR